MKFAGSHGLSSTQRIDLQEQFLRLLQQDWDRVAVAERSGVPSHVVHIEDLRKDALSTMRRCAEFLGIDPQHTSLAHLTYYGYAWHGDIYTEPSTTVHSVRPSRPIRWQERWFCDATIGPIAKRHGYEVGITGPLKWALLRLAAWLPEPELFDAAIAPAAARRRNARSRARARLAWARARNAQWPS
jgi:hypothetical protein